MLNELKSATILLDQVANQLAAQLPVGWQADGPRLVESLAADQVAREQNEPEAGLIDAWLTLRAGKERARLAVEVKTQFQPRDVERLLRALGPRLRRRTASSRNDETVPDGWMLVSSFLSLRSQELLAAEGWNFADATGNVRIELERPRMFIRMQGDTKDPRPTRRDLPTLRGPIAGRLVRALADFWPPYGISELALRAKTSTAMASRVVASLEQDAIIEREGRGTIRAVDWRALLARWAQEYEFARSNRAVRYLAVRGRTPVLDALRRTNAKYAITGGYAAEFMRTVASSPVLTIYTQDIPGLARELELEPLRTPATVVLAEPFDPVVYERIWERDGLRLSAPSQVAADLLTSGDRYPQIGEAVLDWMAQNESAWRA
ncbi:MAG: hypothetical protein IT348_16270 [Candidatus Eisenbacteria bacterium]|nr:hypothetical protein [Candidatus Eisenbacteria bacterium]